MQIADFKLFPKCWLSQTYRQSNLQNSCSKNVFCGHNSLGFRSHHSIQPLNEDSGPTSTFYGLNYVDMSFKWIIRKKTYITGVKDINNIRTLEKIENNLIIFLPSSS